MLMEASDLETFEIKANHLNKPYIILSIKDSVPDSAKWIGIFNKLATEEKLLTNILKEESLFNCMS